MRKKVILFIAVSLLMTGHNAEAKVLPEVTQAAVDEMGVTYGVPCMTGFVFVDGQYLPPPYTVTRRGNAIFINRYQIEQPVAWTYFDSTAADAPLAKEPGAPDDDGDFTEPDVKMNPDAAERAPAKVSSIDALFSEDAGDAAEMPVKEEGGRTIRSIDDLFGDGGEPDEKPAEKPVVQPIQKTVNSIDDLFGDEPVTAKPAAAERAKNIGSIDDLFADDEKMVGIIQPEHAKPAVAAELRPVVPQTPEELKAKKEILKKRLDDKREAYERAIAKGELYFFSTSHNRINGNYGTARSLLEVLPGALRYARSPEDLMSRLKAGNLYFIDLNTCEALYRHKTTFPLLQQRLDNIKEMETLKASK